VTISIQCVQEELEHVSIQAIDDEELSQLDSLIFETAPGIELDNWSTMEIPAIFSDNEM